MKTVLIVLATTLLAPAAHACATAAISHPWNFIDGDQRVTGEYLEELVTGNQVRFVGGAYEDYRGDGSYAFNDGQGNVYNPSEYQFYGDGSRCLNYGSPRYDMYVVNGGELVLINQSGQRFQTTVARR